MVRVTTFKWRWSNQYGNGLTNKAKIYLSHAVSKGKKLAKEGKLKPKVVKQLLPTTKRFRTQVAYNTKYSMSLRAVVINGEHTLDDLRKRIRVFLYTNRKLGKIFQDAEEDEEDFYSEGVEFQKPIGADEDKKLEHNKVYIETFIRGKVELHNG